MWPILYLHTYVVDVSTIYILIKEVKVCRYNDDIYIFVKMAKMKDERC